MNAIKSSQHLCLILAAVVVALTVAVPAKANLVISAGDSTASAGSTGNAFDLTLINSGPAAVALGGFSLEISVDTHVTFAKATTETSLPYVFAGDSLFGPNISASSPGHTFDALDTCIVCGSTIAAGATVGLAHIFFDVVAGSPPGPLTISIAAPPGTSLVDTSGNALAASFLDGSTTITGSGGSIPEPSTLVLFSLPAIFLAKRRFGDRRAG